MPTDNPEIQKLEDRISMLNEALEAALAVSPERDNNFFTGGLSDLYSDRNSWDRKKIFAEALRAWRVNPIARRIVKLATSYVVGKGIEIKSDLPETQVFLDEWGRRNQIRRNVKRWKDEETRTGNLFALFNIQTDRMTIIRMVPAEMVERIITDEQDIENELGYSMDANNTLIYPSKPEEGKDKFMLHYASNQPVGSAWGEADLAPLLVWIGRFSSWLEDRVRLNRFRTAFMYVIRGSYASEEERITREKQINANPPKPGSVLVMNANNGEQWGILAANLDAFDASMDGNSIKKMIMNGAGQPMHWHAEGESSISTTAEAAGTPTFRTLEEMQSDFFEILADMARMACKIKGIPTGTIKVHGPDITERDNATLALALGRSYPHLADMFDRNAIDSKEFMRLTYKMFAEVWSGEAPVIQQKPLIAPGAPTAPKDTETDKTDPKESE